MSSQKGKPFVVRSTTAPPENDVLEELGVLPPSRPAPVAPAPAAESRPRMTVYMSADLQAAVRAAVYHTRNEQDGYENLSDLLEDAAADMIRKLEARYNGGQPFPPMPAGKRLKRGRPIGS